VNDKALVSVIIPTYKRPEFLSNAIDSVLNQTYKNIEIIVVDDNNPDSLERVETEKIMNKYNKNPCIKYIRHEKNKNGSAARNTGIKNSSRRYIAFLDDDDEFLPNKIQLQVERLESLDDSWGMCYTKFVRKKHNKIIDKGIENKEGDISIELLKGSLYISAGSNLMIRRDIVEKINGFNELFLRRQDLEFLIRASQIAKVAHVPEICLIINKDDRSNILTETQLIKNTEEFLSVFDKYISKLQEHEREQVMIGQYLLLARFYLIRMKIRSMLKVCKKHNISIFILIRYIFYLIKRRIFKQCYGFKL